MTPAQPHNDTAPLDLRGALELDPLLDWCRTPEALKLLERFDAMERSSDCWSGELPEAAKAFAEAAEEAEQELSDLRSEAVEDVANATGHDRNSDEWIDAWGEADDDAPTLKEALDGARRRHAGDGYLEVFGA